MKYEPCIQLLTYDKYLQLSIGTDFMYSTDTTRYTLPRTNHTRSVATGLIRDLHEINWRFLEFDTGFIHGKISSFMPSNDASILAWYNVDSVSFNCTVYRVDNKYPIQFVISNHWPNWSLSAFFPQHSVIFSFEGDTHLNTCYLLNTTEGMYRSKWPVSHHAFKIIGYLFDPLVMIAYMSRLSIGLRTDWQLFKRSNDSMV